MFCVCETKLEGLEITGCNRRLDYAASGNLKINNVSFIFGIYINGLFLFSNLTIIKRG